MATPRFYCPSAVALDSLPELPPAAAHHAHRVLRLRVSDAVQIFDGEGNACDAVIHEITGKYVTLTAHKPWPAEAEPALRLTLAQAMCSSEKMDWVIQKATELGAVEIQPVQTQRSVAKLSEERVQRRTRHWHEVAVAACEQSGRNRLPRIHAPQDFNAWLAQVRDSSDTKFILLPQGAQALHTQPRPQRGATLLIGPEGGFTDDEAQLAQSIGFIPLRLGARVLRTETAAIAGLAALQTMWGDFGGV